MGSTFGNGALTGGPEATMVKCREHAALMSLMCVDHQRNFTAQFFSPICIYYGHKP